MSLKSTLDRVAIEQGQIKSDKQLANAIKEGDVLVTLQGAMRDYLQANPIDDLSNDDVKSKIIRDVYYYLIQEGVLVTQLEANAYYYKLLTLYDKELKKLQKELKDQDEQKELKDQDEQIKKNNYRQAINTILNGFIIAILILFAPSLIIGFIIYQILKNMK